MEREKEKERQKYRQGERDGNRVRETYDKHRNNRRN